LSYADPIRGRATFVNCKNIIERSVIFCTGDTFWIDPAWLSSQDEPNRGSTVTFPENVRNYEEATNRSRSGRKQRKNCRANGAAGKLGIPRSTLDAKIKQLKDEEIHHPVRSLFQLRKIRHFPQIASLDYLFRGLFQ